MDDTAERSPFAEGVISVLPILLGVVPFGLVFGATALELDFTALETQGSSLFIFAGASQLAAFDLMADDAPLIVTVLTVWVINLRMLMYSASLAPHLGHLPLRQRLGAAYLLTDQAYAVVIGEYQGGRPARDRLPLYLGAALALWVSWQMSTIVGYLAGSALPADVPLDFAVPLVFLALLMPTLRSRPNIVAAVTAAAVTVAVREIGAGEVAILVGALSGIALGTLSAGTPLKSDS